MSKLKKSDTQKGPVKRKAVSEIESDPGAWERFEHAVDAAVKSGPKHRTASQNLILAKKGGATKKPGR